LTVIHVPATAFQPEREPELKKLGFLKKKIFLGF